MRADSSVGRALQWHCRGQGFKSPSVHRMKKKKFQRCVENFTCETCGFEVGGNGYTDHCPNCLWGKHVDVNPGDRRANCGGMMEPVKAEVKNKGYLLYYICKRCGHKYRVKSAPNDKTGKIMKLINKSSSVV